MATVQEEVQLLRDRVGVLHDALGRLIARVQELAQAVAANDPQAIQQVIDQIDADIQAVDQAVNTTNPPVNP